MAQILLSPRPPTHSPQSTAAGGKFGPHHTDGGAASSAGGAPASAFLGSMLFTRCVSGTRVVPRGQRKSVGGVGFTGYGASVAGYRHDYLTAACAVGLSATELDEFLLRLDKTLRKAKGEKAKENGNKNEKEKAGASAGSPEDARVGAVTATATGTGAEFAAKASQGNGTGENGQHSGAEVKQGLNGAQSPPEAFLPECVEVEGEDWDGVD